MKDDEKKFLIHVYQEVGKETGGTTVFGFPETVFPRDIINQPESNMNYKRAWYLLEKWTDKGLYTFGTTLDMGWLTEEGKQKARELISGKEEG